MQRIEPKISTRLLINPGIGFIAAPHLEQPDSPLLRGDTFRFSRDSRSYGFPDSGVAFISSRWAKLEPLEGAYDWSSVDMALAQTGAAGRLAILRCAPYALGNDDVPLWLRCRNPGKPDFPFWQVDPNTGDYAACWAQFVRALAAHLDGHPCLASVDMAVVGAWGEGGGTEFMRPDKLQPIIDAYIDGFVHTPLQCLLHDPRSLAYIRSRGRPVGFRVDCLGDMGGFHGKRWSHMLDFYPQNIQNFGMDDAWKKAPVVFEACWTMADWHRNGWDIDYIIEESLKWHISSFNAKGVPVPPEWRPQVARWVTQMGYRFELLRILHEDKVMAGDALPITSLWRNSGVAPCYQAFFIVYRLCSAERKVHEVRSDSDIREWLAGEDHLLQDHIPTRGIPRGLYRLSIGIRTGIDGFGPVHIASDSDSTGFVPAGTVFIEG